MADVRQQIDGRRFRRSSGRFNGNRNLQKRPLGDGFVVLGKIGRHTGRASHAATRAGNSRGLGAVAGRGLAAGLAAIDDVEARHMVFATALFLD